MSSFTDPSRVAIAVTPNDTVPISGGQVTRGIYVGGPTSLGNLSVIFPGQTAAVVFSNVAPGSVLPIRVTHVTATNTTSTNIVALY